MRDGGELTEVREKHRFDIDAFNAYCKKHLPGYVKLFSVMQYEGGQSNPTFLLENDAQRFVMRKKPPGKLLPRAHAIEREFRLYKALENTDVPVPRVYLLCDDDSIIGTPFFIMEHIEGRLLKPGEGKDLSAEEMKQAFNNMINVLAALHQVDYQAVGLSDYGKPGGYLQRQVKVWSKQYYAAQTDDFKEVEELINWLNENIPKDDITTIVHGDYSWANVMFHTDTPEVLAVLDWELSTLGHPYTDVAYNCIPFHFYPLGNPLVPSDKTGIPTEKDYVNKYCKKMRIEKIDNWDFYLALSYFRLTSIIQGVYKRGLQGTASSERATQYHDVILLCANAGLESIGLDYN